MWWPAELLKWIYDLTRSKDGVGGFPSGAGHAGVSCAGSREKQHGCAIAGALAAQGALWTE